MPFPWDHPSIVNTAFLDNIELSHVIPSESLCKQLTEVCSIDLLSTKPLVWILIGLFQWIGLI